MDNQGGHDREMPTRVKVKLVSAIVLVVLAVIVVMQNTSPVVTRFLFFTTEMPQAGLMGLTLLIGMLIGILFTLVLLRHAGPRKPR